MSSKNQDHFEETYQSAVKLMEQEWLQAGMSQEELEKSKRVADKLDTLVSLGIDLDSDVSTMKLLVHIGTITKAKTQAIRSVFETYRSSLLDILGMGASCQIEYLEKRVNTEVNDNPQGFSETIQGARNRAKNALLSAAQKEESFSIGIGLESGFIRFQPELEGVFNFDVCCIICGDLMVYGFSQGIEYPCDPVERILSGAEFNSVMEESVGKPPSSQVGILGILTDFKYPRQSVCALAVEQAILRLIHDHDYYHPTTIKPKPWWERRFGAFTDDPLYEEAMRFGAEYRKSQPTPADDDVPA